jgi:hypothetical protein
MDWRQGVSVEGLPFKTWLERYGSPEGDPTTYREVLEYVR